MFHSLDLLVFFVAFARYQDDIFRVGQADGCFNGFFLSVIDSDFFF